MPESAVDGSRFDAKIVNLRGHAARGTTINSAFQIGLSGLSTLQRFAVAAFLTREQYGLWGVLIVALMTLAFIKQVGIADKYIQQSEPDQEAAFQKAFTLELGLSLAFFALAVVALPLFGLAYGHSGILLPGIVLAVAVPLTAFESPAWIPYRRMQYARQRWLTAIDPVVTCAATIALVASGSGYWGLILGAVAGSLAGAIVCATTCPYRLRLRFERGTVREYASFSWPLLGYSLSQIVAVQGSLLVANATVGLAGIGAIGLAGNISQYADKVDAIVSQTVYPVVCAAAKRAELLAEAFVKSNRIALMWAMPVGVGVALFAGDFVHFVLGERWRAAVPLLAVMGLSAALGQVAFNWAVFLRAINHTRPIFIASLAQVVVFLGVAIPAMFAFGVVGYAVGFAAMTVSQVALRAWYMHRLFRGFSAFQQFLRSVAPTVPSVVVVLALRAAHVIADRASLVLVELCAFALVAAGSTYLVERELILELIGYLRRGGTRPAPAKLATDAAATQG
jgi:O-antigen/teichoic acid export membrane protein